MAKLSLSEKELDQIVDRVFNKMKATPEIVGVDELAKYLLVNKAWVYGRMKMLPHFKAGKHTRFVLKDVLASLQGASGGEDKGGNREELEIVACSV